MASDGKLLDASTFGLPVGTVAVLLVALLGAVTPGAIGLYRQSAAETLHAKDISRLEATADEREKARLAALEKQQAQLNAIETWRAVTDERYGTLLRGMQDVQQELKRSTVYVGARKVATGGQE